MWIILSCIAALGLIIFWGGGPNPVWGSATIGLICGLIATTVYYFLGDGFRWSIVGKWVVVFVDLALIEEIIRGLFKRKRRKEAD
jgi:hypothetical protein